MSNIWSFLLQTISATVVVVLLLMMKAIFADKLSPRWQYGIWSVLALRLLIPVASSRWALIPIPLWLETAKGSVEQVLSSAFSQVYIPISVTSPIPLWTNGAISITDWLFVIYVFGVIASLIWYVVSYLRLSLLLRQGYVVDEETLEKIKQVSQKYGLPKCRTIMVSGLPSAFVFGVIRPVLVLPYDIKTDEKILLHELLHLKNHDVLQSVFWCVLRCLHWCNPVLQCVFNIIGNDMESLCDQRVLERLDGEDRREYGGILLAMSNYRYPRGFGTSSISNGGKNISKRISAIVRFKKYPSGMALVSVCIGVVIAAPVFAGVATYKSGQYYPESDGERNSAMAIARLNRCQTIAGALDTFAKGLMYKNGIYIAMASSLDVHENLAEQMRYNQEVGGNGYHVEVGDELGYISIGDGYKVYNLERQPDESYNALIVFVVSSFEDPQGDGVWQNENGDIYSGRMAIPVKISKEDGWVVKEMGQRIAVRERYLNILVEKEEKLPSLIYKEQTGESGSVNMEIWTEYTVSNSVQNNQWDFFNTTSFDKTPKPQAEFENCVQLVYVTYVYGGTQQQLEKLTYVGMSVSPMGDENEEPVFKEADGYSNGGWSSSDGTSGAGTPVIPQWDGVLFSGGGSSVDMKNQIAQPPKAYAVRIYWNQEQVEDFIFKGMS